MLKGPFCHRGNIQPDSCGRCRYYVKRASDAERARMDADTGSPQPAPVAVKRPAVGSPKVPTATSLPVFSPCVHETGAIATYCTTCNKGAAEQRHVRDCDLHGLVTRWPAGGGKGECHSCVDYQAEDKPPPKVRHLAYHLYPVAGNGVWQENVDQLCRRLDLFNGKVVVAVAVDPPEGRGKDPTGHGEPDRNRVLGRCDTFADVVARFGRHASRIEFQEHVNDPHKREVGTFGALFSALPKDDPTHVTLYAQAKGVTRPRGHVAHTWTRSLYEIYLDYWGMVERQLRRYSVTGAFKKVGHGWPLEQTKSDWHYSGSWLWFRNADLLRKDWHRIDDFWGGIESYPSLHYRKEQAGCLFMEGPVPAINLYNAEFWTLSVLPELYRWKSANGALATRASAPVRQLNVGCGPHYFPGWWNVDVVETTTIKPDQVVAEGSPLPFAAGSFDRVFLGHVLEHMPWQDVVACLQDVRRVLAPGGEVCVVGPDTKKALAALLANPDKRGAMSHVWEVIEDRNHYQRNEPEFDWPAARHHWNCYGERVAWAMERAGFVDVRDAELTPEAFGEWPVADYTNRNQCSVLGRAP